MKRIIVTILSLLLIAASASAYSISYNWNDLRSADVTDVLAYSWGYDDGYEHAEDGDAQQPYTLGGQWMRLPYSDPDYLGSELAYREKGSYTKGYRDGYSDGKYDKVRAVEDNFLEYYDDMGVLEINDEEEEEEVASVAASEVTGTGISGGWVLEELDLSSVANLAYGVGYDDAAAGNSKAPLKLMEDLAKHEQHPEVSEILEWIRADRGTYIKKYREGYEYVVEQAAGTIVQSGINSGGNSDQASQQSGAEQDEAAWDLGYQLGYAKAMERKASAPHEIDNYEWMLDSRYIDQENEHEDRYWYNPPVISGIELSRNEIEIFYADEAEYLKGYREGYAIGKEELSATEQELTDEEYVWSLGCQIAEDGGNVYNYNWIQRRYAQTTEDLDNVKMVRYHRAELYKGYRACKE